MFEVFDNHKNTPPFVRDFPSDEENQLTLLSA